MMRRDIQKFTEKPGQSKQQDSYMNLEEVFCATVHYIHLEVMILYWYYRGNANIILHYTQAIGCVNKIRGENLTEPVN